MVRTGSSWHREASYWSGKAEDVICDLCGKSKDSAAHVIWTWCAQKDQRELQKLSWHSRVCKTGYELVATVAIVLCCVGALPVELLKAAVDWEAGVPGAK